MSGDPVEPIARAVLYRSRLLRPHHRSPPGEDRRGNLGGAYPPGFRPGAGEGEAARLRCEVPVEGTESSRVTAELRCLHLVRRQVMAPADGAARPVDRLETGGRVYLTGDEAAERRWNRPGAGLGDLERRPRDADFTYPAGSKDQVVGDGAGGRVGLLRRSWETLIAEARMEAVCDGAGFFRLALTVTNRSPWRGGNRAEARRHSLLSTEIVLRVEDGRFHSVIDPPPEAAAAAGACRNEGLWPVLVGEERSGDTVLAAPIPLGDYPRAAPGSPGDPDDDEATGPPLTVDLPGLGGEEGRDLGAPGSGRRGRPRCPEAGAAAPGPGPGA